VGYISTINRISGFVKPDLKNIETILTEDPVQKDHILRKIEKSTADPEYGMFHKREQEKCFAYTVPYSLRPHNFVLGVGLLPAKGYCKPYKSIFSLYRSRIRTSA
jgi:hypothetical protein